MQIQLSVVSSKVELPGLSDGIEKLNQLREILNELRGGKPVEVKIGVSGLDKMKQQTKQAAQEVSNMTQSLIKQLEMIGGPSSLMQTKVPVGKLKAGFADAAAEIKYLSDLKKQLHTEGSKYAPMQKDAVEGAINTAQLRIEELQGSLAGAAGAEEKLTGASKTSGKALEGQAEIIAAKAKLLEKLTGAADKATASEAKLGAEARKQGGGMKAEGGSGGGTLIGEKYIEVNGGEEGRQKVSETRQIAPGHVSVATDKATTETISEVEKLRHALAELKAQYEANMAAGARSGQTERELAQITRNHAEAVIAKGKALEGTTAGRGAMQQGEALLRRASEMEARARGQTIRTAPGGGEAGSYAAGQKWMADAIREAERAQREYDAAEARARARTMRPAPGGGQARSFRETQKREREQLRGAIRADMAAHQEEIVLGKASMRTDAEKIAMLNKKAQAYRFLAGEARQAGHADLGMQLDRRAAGVESDAVRLGNKPHGFGGMIGAKLGDLPKTMATVTLWMTAYSAFFNGMKMIDSGIEAMIKYDAQTAQLQSVMRGTHEEAAALRDTVLGLAIATGRSGEEAMDSAIRWSRLGLTQKEVAQATEISLKSASISGQTAEESTEQLSGLVASWGLTIPQLNSAFEQMNALAVRFNASDKELMSGLARTGSLAHQMGMDMSAAMSLVSLISGTTGRPGSEAGNAIKRYLVNVGKPEVQEKLAQNFGVKILDDSGNLKEQSELLGDLSVKFKTLSTARQNELVSTLAGALQANRLAIVLKDLTKAQALEVESLMDFNRADIENANRRATMEKDLNALKTEWGKMWITAGENSGAISGIREVIVELTGLMNLLNGNWRRTGSKDEAIVKKYAITTLYRPGGDVDDRMQGGGFDLWGETDEQYAKRMKQGAAAIDAIMRQRRENGEKGLGVDPQDDKNVSGQYFEEMAENPGGHEDDDTHLQHLTATAQTAHKVVNNLGEAMDGVRKGALTQRDMENVSRGAFPFAGEGKAEGDFTDKMRELEKRGDKEGEIALLLERQVEVKQRAAQADQEEIDARKKLVASYDDELAANQKVIDAKVKAGEDVKELRKTQDALDDARQQAATPVTYADKDEEGMVPTDYPVVTHGKMAGIGQVFGALPSQRYEADKIKREKEMNARQQAALDAMEAGKGGQMLDTEKAQLETELREKRLEIAGREPYAAIQDQVTLSERTAQNTMAAAAVGRNEPQQQRNEIRAAEAAALAARGPSDAVDAIDKKFEDMAPPRNAEEAAARVSERQLALDKDRATALGRVAEVETYISSLKEMQISNEERRAKVAADITNETRKQNEEAAKALLMGSREDQLKAVLTKAAIDRRGGRGFSANEFQFLSQDMRQNVERYNPNALPPEYMNHLRELKREQGQAGALGEELPGAIMRLEATLAKLPQFQLPSDKAGGSLVQIGAPSFHFTFSDEFKQLASTVVEAVKRPLQIELSNIRSMVFSLMSGHELGKAQSAAQGY